LGFFKLLALCKIHCLIELKIEMLIVIDRLT
jgi:hypothetical protein